MSGTTIAASDRKRASPAYLERARVCKYGKGRGRGGQNVIEGREKDWTASATRRQNNKTHTCAGQTETRGRGWVPGKFWGNCMWWRAWETAETAENSRKQGGGGGECSADTSRFVGIFGNIWEYWILSPIFLPNNLTHLHSERFSLRLPSIPSAPLSTWSLLRIVVVVCPFVYFILVCVILRSASLTWGGPIFFFPYVPGVGWWSNLCSFTDVGTLASPCCIHSLCRFSLLVWRRIVESQWWSRYFAAL